MRRKLLPYGRGEVNGSSDFDCTHSLPSSFRYREQQEFRARVPLAVLRDTIQPFPTFSEIFVDAVHALRTALRTPMGVR